MTSNVPGDQRRDPADSTGLWSVTCRDAAGVDGDISVSVNEEFRVVMELPSGDSAILSWKAAENLRAALASAVSAVLRGERR